MNEEIMLSGFAYVEVYYDENVQHPGDPDGEKGAWVISVGDEDCIKGRFVTWVEPSVKCPQ